MAGIAIIGGSLSSLVGLGGGVIFNPLMIEFGVHPKVSGSTSIYLITISTFSATIQFMLLGILPIDYTLFLSCLVFIFIILGNLVINRIVEKIGKPSILAMFLADVIILCTIIVL
mmetsp:Transcript_18863/g.21092  ORF Transcript_18863/g.21092 Transcript_18863/m.21092 type:complete len:115 (-) Transcript_18863:91-435(-)